jgi:hypothetical protein
MKFLKPSLTGISTHKMLNNGHYSILVISVLPPQPIRTRRIVNLGPICRSVDQEEALPMQEFRKYLTKVEKKPPALSARRRARKRSLLSTMGTRQR